MATRVGKNVMVQVVHVAVIRSGAQGDEVLLLRRANTGRGDGSWDCPAGRVESGEDLAEAAVRELAEEVGLVARADDLIQIHDEVVRVDGSSVRHVFFYASRWSGVEENREPDRADRMEWFPFANLPSPQLPFVQRGLARVGSH